MRFYEAVTPLRSQVAQLSVKTDSLTEELDTNRTQMRGLMDVRKTHSELFLLYLDLIFSNLLLDVKLCVRFDSQLGK